MRFTIDFSFIFFRGQSNERQFLKDFWTCAPGSSGARLAAWLQPEPRLDPNRCQLKPISEPVRYGWPTHLRVVTRDQYGDNVFVPDLKIEIKAVPAGTVSNARRTFTTSGIPFPPKINYEPVLNEKMCFKAITFMNAYDQYSFEELRFANPVQSRVTETFLAHDLGDGTFGATWTPNAVGSFCITVSIDGIALEEIYRVDVKETGVPPPPQKSNIKKSLPPSKIRKFIAKCTAGLRIRSHPTLQSEQVGIVKVNGTLMFIDEIENDDGFWVRLSTESIRQHCTSGWYPMEAWCLQFNQHTARTLLYPVIEPQTATTTKITKAVDKMRKNSHTQCDAGDPESGELPAKMKSGSPSKKGFDFATNKVRI